MTLHPTLKFRRSMSLKKPCAIKIYINNQPTKIQKRNSNEHSEQWAEEYKLSPKFAEWLNEDKKFAECEAVTPVCFILFQKRTDEFNKNNCWTILLLEWLMNTHRLSDMQQILCVLLFSPNNSCHYSWSTRLLLTEISSLSCAV